MSRTDKYDSIENVKSIKNTKYDDKYKEENSQHQDGNESVTNKTKAEEAIIKRLIYTNFKQNVTQCVIDIFNLCGGK